jgi:hypothetical protein
MHRYTQLKKDELLNKMRVEREKEWDQHASSWSTRGRSLPNGSLISGFLEIGFKWLENFMDGLFEAEKAALSREGATPSPKYFSDLAEEFKTIFQQEVNVIRSRALQCTQGIGRPLYESIITTVSHNEADIRESTNRKVQIMEQELKLGIPKTATHQTIQVTGDVGVINTGQVFGSINSTVKRFSGTGATELANALLHLAQGIKDPNIDEAEKLEHLEKIEFLAAQREIPEAQRKKGPIKAVVQGLDRCLGTAASLAMLWGQFAPTITKAFGI